jgi:predicted RNase H-like HicB family nuclease
VISARKFLLFYPKRPDLYTNRYGNAAGEFAVKSPSVVAACLPDMVYSNKMRELIVYQDNDGQWVAECPEMPGYRAKAGSKEEAVEKMKAALLVFFPCKCED